MGAKKDQKRREVAPSPLGRGSSARVGPTTPVRMKGSKGRSSDVANVILPSIGIRSRHVTGKGSNGKVRAVLVFFLESYK